MDETINVCCGKSFNECTCPHHDVLSFEEAVHAVNVTVYQTYAAELCYDQCKYAGRARCRPYIQWLREAFDMTGRNVPPDIEPCGDWTPLYIHNPLED